MLLMIPSKRAEGQEAERTDIVINAPINSNLQKMQHAEFVKDFFAQIVAVNVWVAT